MLQRQLENVCMHDRVFMTIRWCLVAALIGPVCAAMEQGPRRWTLKRLREGYREAYQSSDYDRAIELMLELDRKSPDLPDQAYNLACLYALTRQKDEAIKWLQRSTELGFAGHRLVTFDDDLSNIRDRAEFPDAVARIARSYEKALAAFKEEAAAPDPVVILPPNRDASEPAPLIVAMHGYGGEAAEMADAWREAASELGAIVIAPRAIRKVIGAGYSWGRTDEAEFLVLRAVDHIAARYKVDAKRIVLMGFSQGAYMSLAIGLRNAERFRGVIPLCGGYHPIVLKEVDPSAKRLPRFFLMAGDRDAGTPEMRKAATDLEEFGARVRIVVYKDTAHHFPPDRIGAQRDALKYILADE